MNPRGVHDGHASLSCMRILRIVLSSPPSGGLTDVESMMNLPLAIIAGFFATAVMAVGTGFVGVNIMGSLGAVVGAFLRFDPNSC